GEAALREIAGDLGADVPFLTSSHVAAFASGRGDVLASRVRFDLPAREVFLVLPAFSVATADAYRWLDTDRMHAAAAEPRRPPQRATWTWDAAEELARAGAGNDFEPVVEARYPQLRGYR